MEDKKDSDFNSKSISQMTYAEIIQKNREQHKGTFMDKSWRKSEEGLKILSDPELSGW
jgi:hypothetical protein